MSTSDAPNLRRLARQLADYGRRLRHLETVPQLAHSSLDDHGMPVYDADGNLTVTIGKQADGTWGAPPVRGPVPPQPAGVEAEGDAGVIRASWQGVFWAGAAKPMDFEAVEVLVDGAVYAGIHDPQGGSVSVPALPGVRTVSFRTLSQAGVVSAAMGHVQVTVEPRVSEQMQELHESLDELNDVTLPELQDALADSAEDLQGKLDSLNARVDDLVVDGGGSGNFTTYSINEPSGDGTGEGDQWFRVVNGEVLGQWRWDGTAWQAVTLTDAIIAGIDLSKLVSNGNLSEIVANKMFTDLFAANKITSQEIAAGSITTEKIAAEGIIANVIQGGAFTGETFEGGSFVGGEFRTSDDLPGQVRLSDTAADGGPGLQVTPSGAGDYETLPWIGPRNGGISLDGGEDGAGNGSFAFVSPRMVNLQTSRDGKEAGSVYVSENLVSLSRRAALGERGEVAAFPGFVRVRYEYGGVERGLAIDQSGVWVHTNRDGATKYYNLEETAQDSGWINMPYASGYQHAGSGAPFQYRRAGNMIHMRGRITRSSGSFAQGTAYVVGTLPPEFRPSYTQRTIISGGGATTWGRIEVSAGNGQVSIAFTASDSVWADLSGTYWTTD